mgnify:CR=1
MKIRAKDITVITSSYVYNLKKNYLLSKFITVTVYINHPVNLAVNSSAIYLGENKTTTFVGINELLSITLIYKNRLS